jgi:hypothetical protein
MNEYFDLVLWVKESRAAAGVPEKIEDKTTLTDIAALLWLGGVEPSKAQAASAKRTNEYGCCQG